MSNNLTKAIEQYFHGLTNISKHSISIFTKNTLEATTINRQLTSTICHHNGWILPSIDNIRVKNEKRGKRGEYI